MFPEPHPLSRRRLLGGLLALAAGAMLPPLTTRARSSDILTREVPATGESLPLVGLGSWITFNVGDDPLLLEACTAVMARLMPPG